MSPRPPCQALAWAAIVLALSACEGKSVLGVAGPFAATQPTDAAKATQQVPKVSVRRLSRAEVADSIKELLGVEAPEALVILPEDPGTPFDNDYTLQQASAVLVEGVESLTETVTARALANPVVRERLIPCTPTGPDDDSCLRKVITTFGRRALRRTLTEAEVEAFLSARALAVRSGSFDTAVGVVVRSMLQDVEFLYRVELGTPVEGKPGVHRLGAFELASRLSFFLWGRTPPDWLLDLAEQGQLETPEQVRAAAEKLLEDPKARRQVERFHALWLGYESLPHSAELVGALSTETSALVDKVVFQDRADYFQLFLSEQTWANDLLVSHYGLSAPTAPGYRWVGYGGTGRKGILSHGSLLSNGAKQLDTSPTLRGLWIRNRLFCQVIPPPPPNANADVPPQGSDGGSCKPERYSAHANVGSCASCHQAMDPVGFGLENYDRAGRYRTHEVGDPSCAIQGDGELTGIGRFNGPGELAELLTTSGELEPCIVRQVFRFASGREETKDDQVLLQQLEEAFISGGRRFDQLLLGVISQPSFMLRRESEEG